MIENDKLSLAYSSCPNDTFIFNGIANNLIDLQGMEFNITLADVETLNKQALNTVHDITKLSFAAFGSVRDKYRLLEVGSALGRGCGPLIISRTKRKIYDINEPLISVPGLGTTAYHLLMLFLNDLRQGSGKGVHPHIIPMSFEKIMPHVLKGESDFGVIIHEGRFVYENSGLNLVCDLGTWWEKKTLLPIPLGCIAVKKKMDRNLGEKIEILIKKSIQHAEKNPGKAFEYIKKHAREIDGNVIQQHIDLYVNGFTKELGKKGKEAVKLFFSETIKAGILPESREELFLSDKT